MADNSRRDHGFSPPGDRDAAVEDEAAVPPHGAPTSSAFSSTR